MQLNLNKLLLLCIQMLCINEYDAIRCYTSSFYSTTCSTFGSCIAYSRKGFFGYGCSANGCSAAYDNYPYSDGYTVYCCSSSNCNTYTNQPLSKSINCYDNTTSASITGKCSATGGCYTISNGTTTYKGCTELSCYDVRLTYSLTKGYTTSCCTTSLCNGPGNYSTKVNILKTLLLISFFISLLNFNKN